MIENGDFDTVKSAPSPMIKEEENRPTAPEVNMMGEPPKATASVPDHPKADILKMEGSSHGQKLTPPASNTTGTNSQTLGAGNTQDTTFASDPSKIDNSALNLLLDITDDGANNDGINDDLDQFFIDGSDNILSQDVTNTQNTDFDLSSFGNNTQDFSMPDLQTSDNGTNQQSGMKADAVMTAGDNMDLDMLFEDDIFFGTGDDVNMDGGEMEHGEHDSMYFGLD